MRRDPPGLWPVMRKETAADLRPVFSKAMRQVADTLTSQGDLARKTRIDGINLTM